MKENKKILAFVGLAEFLFLLCGFLAVQLWESVVSDKDAKSVVVNITPDTHSSLPVAPLRSVYTYHPHSYSSSTDLWKSSPVRPQMSSNSTILFHHKLSASKTQSYGGSQALSAPQSTSRSPIGSTSSQSAAPQMQSVSLPVIYAPHMTYAFNQQNVERMSARKAPGGSIEDSWESWYRQYVSDTGSEDLSGLEAWWNLNFGSGYPPDIFNAWKAWVELNHPFGTPMPDGIWVLLFMIVLFAILRVRKNVKQNKKVQS